MNINLIKNPKTIIGVIISCLGVFYAFRDISLDNFYTTDSPINKKLVYEIYAKLIANDDIETKTRRTQQGPDEAMR